MRAQHETNEDKKNERVVKDIIREYHDYWSIHKPTNKHYSVIDCFAFDKSFKCAGIFEVKCRNLRWGKYDTIVLSAGKWADGFKFSQALNVPFYLVISAIDGTFEYKQNLADVRNGKIYCEWGGRTSDPRDSGDIEPMMYIPIELFTKISDESSHTSTNQVVDVAESTPSELLEFEANLSGLIDSLRKSYVMVH